MKYINSIKTSLLIILICFFTFCSGYTMGSSFVYADTTTDNWTSVTTNDELVEAFRYYCKSRDLTIDGSFADGVTKFTTITFNNICNSLGIDVTALQAHLKRDTDGNLGVRFLFDTTGITAYNRIFAQFLQDNDLNVGDSYPENNPKVLYSGVIFEDYDHNSCLAYVSTSNGGSEESVNSYYAVPSYVTYKGTPYILSGRSASISGPSTITVKTNQNSTTDITISVSNNNIGSTGKDVDLTRFRRGNNASLYVYGRQQYYTNSNMNVIKDYLEYNGEMAIIYFNNAYYLGFFNNSSYVDSVNATVTYKTRLVSTNVRMYPYEETNAHVFITTYNTTINNNNYEGDTIINNNGTPDDPNNPLPDPDPDPDTPELPAPDTEPATDWDIELPDLTIPNWILSGKENKFPFDIPFNVMYALSLLQAEPQAPELEGTLDFGFYEWEYALDLSDFDSVAEICRDMEFLAFLTGLMLMTRKLIWG